MRWIERQYRKEPHVHPWREPTEFITSAASPPGSGKMMDAGEPYMTRARENSDGKCSFKGVHMDERQYELKAFFASQQMSMWEGWDSKWARMAAAMSSHPPGTEIPNWSGLGWRKKERSWGVTDFRARAPSKRMMTCPTTMGLKSPSSDFGTATPRPALRRLATTDGTRPAAMRLRTAVIASEVGS
jgi:hypothetical protein